MLGQYEPVLSDFIFVTLAIYLRAGVIIAKFLNTLFHSTVYNIYRLLRSSMFDNFSKKTRIVQLVSVVRLVSRERMQRTLQVNCINCNFRRHKTIEPAQKHLPVFATDRRQQTVS